MFKNRLQNYKKIKRKLETENQIEKCGLKPFLYKQIGSTSVSGIALRLDFPIDRPKYSLIAKVMEYNHKNIREIRNYQLFIGEVLKKHTPHFPLIWESIECKDKCYFIDPKRITEYLRDKNDLRKWERIREKKCFILFAELFKGDSKAFFKQFGYNESLCMSFLAQALMGLKTIEDKGLSHGDFHIGNILYTYINERKQVEDDNMYFKYVFDKDNIYYLKHFNTLFVLWDFEKMKETGTVSAHALSTEWLESRDFSFEKNEPPNCTYWDMTVVTQSLSDTFPSSRLIKELCRDYLRYTNEYISNGKHVFYKVKDLLDHLIKKLGPNNTILLHNPNIKLKVTKTFYI